MERIFSKVKIFILKKIVFPVLQLIAKYKAKKKIESKVETKYITGEYTFTSNEETIVVNWENKIITPKEYGQYLQQNGKQIWVKKLK
jgi:hypothetical protein